MLDILEVLKKTNPNVKVRGTVEEQIAERESVMKARQQMSKPMAMIVKSLQEMTVEELQEKKQKILDTNSGWKSCQDGSYEMALFSSGFDDVVDELEKRGV